jgi:hypothetical protein
MDQCGIMKILGWQDALNIGSTRGLSGRSAWAGKVGRRTTNDYRPIIDRVFAFAS